MGAEPFGGAYAGRRVLVTGHTGFVGSWAVRWLSQLGAGAVGYSRGRARPPVPAPDGLVELTGDLEDAGRTRRLLDEHAPQLVLHLAGETLVSRGFAAPAETFRNNLLGALSVLDAALHSPHTRGVLLLGTPAVAPTGGPRAPVGPYAASKQAVDAIVAGYAHSGTQQPVRDTPLLVGVVRPGVMVGGDWAADRLVPDAVRAVRAGRPVALRTPDAVRTWQHVLDGLSGILTVGWHMLRGELPRLSYDIGRTDPATAEPAHQLVAALLAGLGVPEWPVETGAAGSGDRLRLGCAAATDELRWLPTWDLAAAAAATAAWYRTSLDEPRSLGAVTDAQIRTFVDEGRRQEVSWAVGRPAGDSRMEPAG